VSQLPMEAGWARPMVPPWSCELAEVIYGIDPSTLRIALGALDYRPGLGYPDMAAPRPVVTPGLLSLDTATTECARLAGARDRILPWLEQRAAPALLVIEKPFASGQHVPHESFHLIGVLKECVWRAYGLETEVLMLSPSEWKMRALGAGKGFAEKPAILAWARATLGFDGVCERCGNGLEPEEKLGRPGAKSGKRKLKLVCPRPSPAHDVADGLGLAVAGAVELERRRSR
jgi:hypothetical protein